VGGAHLRQIKFTRITARALYRRSSIFSGGAIVAPTLFFDTANGRLRGKNRRTNTPLHRAGDAQRLTYVEAARAFAERDDAGKKRTMRRALNDAFRRCTARLPSGKGTAKFSQIH